MRDTFRSLSSLPPGAPTVKSPPRMPQFEVVPLGECRSRIGEAMAADLPQELSFMNPSTRAVQWKQLGKRHSIAGSIIDSPMTDAFEKICQGSFRIEENGGEHTPQFFARNIHISLSTEPSMDISFNLMADMLIQHMLKVFVEPNPAVTISRSKADEGFPVRFLFKGLYQWADGGFLYIPMEPVDWSVANFPVHWFMGEAGFYFVPVDAGRTVIGLCLEDMPFSQNPQVFLEGIRSVF